MSRYMDAEFGVSFWYPSQWTVSEIKLTDIEKAHYPEGRIQRRLFVSNHDKGFYFDEINSATSSLTSPADRGCALTYSLNLQNDAWMQQTTGCDGDPTPVPAALVEQSFYTTGGLRILNGASRFQTELLVPLTAWKFIDVSYEGSLEVGSRMSTLPIVTSISSLEFDQATSVEKEIQVIQAEQDSYAGQ
ncbi:hypothetical protein [Bradyrhizobium niftali]|uniref:Uncharacterized protein n=1 Tax=Bradyrhizobium niftali TaxID=2560055 RepID=A0A4Y9L3I2_9BRAD|nr:hypothetical protein [Bradyrhizobium niftali]TFV37965.1 hypothetical protein E4K65_42530 [Bradyrhizobium niftali]